MMSFLKKFTPQNFRKGILIIEKLLILLATSAAYLGMLELFYSAVCTDFSKILILFGNFCFAVQRIWMLENRNFAA